MWKTRMLCSVMLFACSLAAAQELPPQDNLRWEGVLLDLIETQDTRTYLTTLNGTNNPSFNAASLQCGYLLASARAWLSLAAAIPPSEPLHQLYVHFADALVRQAWYVLHNNW